MAYACPAWKAVARSPVQRLQVPSPRYWCLLVLSNRQIHEDLGVPMSADHIRALNESFDPKVADVGKPLVWQIGRFSS